MEFDPFDDLPPLEGTDTILELGRRFNADPRTHKVNGGIGMMYGPDGKLITFPTVKAVGDGLGFGRTGYAPAAGVEDFGRLTAELIFGADSQVIAQKRLASIATNGGIGAIRIGFELCKILRRKLVVSDPTWPPHRRISKRLEIPAKAYSHLSADRKTYNHGAFIDAINDEPDRTVVLFHAGSTHNPTGLNPSIKQWEELAKVMHGKIAFFDAAYPGLGEDLTTDLAAIRAFVEAGIPVWVALSLSKIMTLYSKRAGILLVDTKGGKTRENVQAYLNTFAREMYSSAAAQGQDIAARILSDQTLRQAWMKELTDARAGIKDTRVELDRVVGLKGLQDHLPRFSDSKGLFTILDFPKELVERLIVEDAVYLLADMLYGQEIARINVSGLTREQISRVLDAIAEKLGKI